MKKFLLSAAVFAASAMYVAAQHVSGSQAVATSPLSDTSSLVAESPAPAQTPSSSTPPPATPKATPTPVSKPSKPQGQYADGVYTGSQADAYYGTIQVEATIQGGKLTDVSFLQYPNDRRTSQYINSIAMPRLRQEAIAAQSANVSGVSGASDTSAAFREALGSALSQAKS